MFPDALASRSRGHIQQQCPSIRVFPRLCGSWAGLTTSPSLSPTWRRPRRCIGTCWGPRWVRRCPCPIMVSTLCSWSSATPSWSCSILSERRAPSRASCRRTSQEECITFVSRWDGDDRGELLLHFCMTASFICSRDPKFTRLNSEFGHFRTSSCPGLLWRAYNEWVYWYKALVALVFYEPILAFWFIFIFLLLWGCAAAKSFSRVLWGLWVRMAQRKHASLQTVTWYL